MVALHRATIQRLLSRAQPCYRDHVLSTTEVAAMAETTRHTVEREIARGNLAAEKIGRTWVIEQAEAERWAAQFQPYASLRKPTNPS
jgi:excisionase family DNA binding protein